MQTENPKNDQNILNLYFITPPLPPYPVTKTTDLEGEQSESGEKNGTQPAFEPGAIEILRVTEALSNHYTSSAGWS